MIFELELWTNYEAAGGTRKSSGFIDYLVDGGEQPFDIDKRDRFTFIVTPETASRISFRDVVRCTNQFDEVTEWAVDFKEDGADLDGETVVQVSCMSAFEDITRNTGLVRFLDGQHYAFSVGGVGITPTQYLQAFIIDGLDDYGVSYISLGTVDYTTELDQAFEGVSHLQALRQLAQVTGGEIEWIRTSGSVYTLGLRTTIGDQTKMIRVASDKNLIELKRTIELGDMATVIVPLGRRGSDQERAGPGYATWEVSADSPITLVDPNGGDGPVGFTDQITGWFVKKATPAASQVSGDPADLYLTEILSSTTAGVISVRNEDGIAVGDYVEIREDADGTFVTELSNPAAVTSYRRITRTFERDAIRGERNQLRNVFGKTWATRPTVYALQKDTTENLAVFQVKGLPADQEITAGDVIVFPSQATITHRKITADTTADGAGDATVTISSAINVPDNTAGFLVHTAGDLPEYWERADGTAAMESWPLPITRGGPESLTADVDGAQTRGGTNPLTLSLKNMTVGAEVEPGWIMQTATAWYWVLDGGVVDGSGLLDVVLRLTGPVSFSDEEDVTFRKADLGAGDSGYAVGHILGFTVAAIKQSVTVYYDAHNPTLHVSAEVVAKAAGAGTASGWDPLQSPLTPSPPELRLTESGGTPELASVEDVAWVPAAAGEERNVTLRTSDTMTATDDFEVHFRFPRLEAGTMGFTPPWTWLMGIQLHLGPDAVVPIHEGSLATQLWQEANTKLETLSVEPRAFELLWTDLSRIANLDRDQPELGSWVHIELPERGIDVEGRIVKLTLFPTAPQEARVVIDTRPDLASQRLAKSRPAPVFVRVDVTIPEIVAPAEGQPIVYDEPVEVVTATEETPPAQTQGAVRFVGKKAAYTNSYEPE